MRIVRGGPEDVARLEPLWLAMRDHHEACEPAAGEGIPFRERSASWEIRAPRYRKWLEDPGTVLFLAEEDGRAVGYAFTTIGSQESTLATGERVGQLQTLSVAADARGRGIGSALIDAFLEHLRAEGVREWSLGVLDGNDDARRLYERYGLRAYVIEMIGPVPGPTDAVERT